MNQRRIDWITAGIVVVVALVVYLLTVSPTVAFWDVGEFLACSANLGVPHPPGTPLYVLIGRIFSMIPISPEIAFRINFISVLCGALSTGLIVLIISRVIRSFKRFAIVEKAKWLPVVAGVVGAVFTMIAYTAWENALEAEVYTPSALIGLGVVFLALIWREQTTRPKGKPGEVSSTQFSIFKGPKIANRLMLLILYIIFLSAGIHLTPVMMLFALIPFVAMIDHKVLPGFLIGIVGLSFMLFRPGWTQLAVTGLFAVYFLTQAKQGRWGSVLLFLAAYILLIILAAVGVSLPVLLVGVGLLFLAFIYAGIKCKVDMKFFAVATILLLIAASIQFYILIRAQQYPSINMVNPSTWERFMSVLRREQYGVPTVENQIWPRKTVIDIETGQPTGLVAVKPGLGSAIAQLVVGYFWQMALYFKYFFWQWGLQALAGKPFLVVAGRVLLAAIPTTLGVFGLYSLAKRDRKLFWLFLTTFLVSSFGLLVYLNMRFGHTGPLPRGLVNLPQEVRERDYFFTFSYVFYALFTGFGFFEFVSALGHKIKQESRARILSLAGGGVSLGLAVIIALINLPMLSRRNDWIPLEYGYNILACCEEPSVIITNGDNDTFPLWFVQEVPSTRYENNEKPYKAGVINANLSLLNTAWYVEQLKRKGAPLSFVYESVDEKVTFAQRGGGWEGYVAHPPIKEETLEIVLSGRTVKADKSGVLLDPELGAIIGEVTLVNGRIFLNNPPPGGYVTVSYGSAEIDKLPPFSFLLDASGHITLADIIIRDMLATNAGITYTDAEKVPVLWPDQSGTRLIQVDTFTWLPSDYLLPIDQFCEKIFPHYKEGVMPLYFSTTVSPGRVRQFAPFLSQEGQAYRFTSPADTIMEKLLWDQSRQIWAYAFQRPGEGPDGETRTELVYAYQPQMDLERTYRLFTEEYMLTSALDPRVRHHEQTDMMYGQYGMLMLEIGARIAMQGEHRRAYDFVKPVASFDVEDEVRRIFLLNIYNFATKAGNMQDAQRYFDELERNDWLGADFYLSKGLGFLESGNVTMAYENFEKVLDKTTRDNPQPVIDLFQIYIELLNDVVRARDLVDKWDEKHPNDDVSIGLYLELNDIANALRVLDQTIKIKPDELWRRQIRDSLRNMLYGGQPEQRGIVPISPQVPQGGVIR